MRTYAEYLATQTVKTLNTIARDMGLKGYSKLRKAELIAFIDKAIEADGDVAHLYAPATPIILDVEQESDHDRIREIMSNGTAFQPVWMAAGQPAKAPESAPKATTETEVERTTLEDLKAAYRNMRATINRMGGRGAEGERRIRYVGKLRCLAAQLRSVGVKYPQYL